MLCQECACNYRKKICPPRPVSVKAGKGLLLLCRAKGIAAGAIGAVGGDLYRVETAVATVDVVAAKAHVAFYRVIDFVHMTSLKIIRS